MRTAIIGLFLMLAAASSLNANVVAQAPSAAANKATATISGRIANARLAPGLNFTSRMPLIADRSNGVQGQARRIR